MGRKPRSGERPSASLMRESGNFSIIGAILCRAQNASIREVLAGLPSGEPETDFCPLSKVNATAVNQVVTSPASNLAFVTYTSTAPGALLPYYVPVSGGAAGTVNYVTLTGSSAITAPLTGAFSPDNKLFFVSTSGDNLIHFIDVPTLKDTQQINPNLPGCTPGTDAGCTLPSTTTHVPALAIAVKPRTTT